HTVNSVTPQTEITINFNPFRSDIGQNRFRFFNHPPLTSSVAESAPVYLRSLRLACSVAPAFAGKRSSVSRWPRVSLHQSIESEWRARRSSYRSDSSGSLRACARNGFARL